MELNAKAESEVWNIFLMQLNDGWMPQCDNTSHNTLNKDEPMKLHEKKKHLTLMREGKISML